MSYPVIQNGMNRFSAAQELVNKTLREAEASKWYVGSRAGVQVPSFVQFPTPRGYPISQIQASLQYPRTPLKARFLLDL